MKNQNVFRDFSKYVSLNILGQLAYSCYTLADTFFVSAKLGANGLTALNLAFPILCLINGTGLMLGMGGGTKYSICKSRNEEKQANQIFTNALYLVVLFAIVFVLAGVFFSGTIVKVLGADGTVFDITNTYLRVMMLFAPAFLTNHLLQCFLRNDGKPSLSMAAMIVGSLSNVVLDYIFIFPLNMGIFGAIFATGLAPVISIAVLSPYFITGKNKFSLVKSAPCEKDLGGILSSGVSPFLTEATSGIVMFLFNFIILRISGNVGVAAFGVITVISLVVVAIYTGLSQGIQPIISRNYGSGNAKNVNSILKYAIVTMLILSGAIYSIIFFGASALTSVFNSEGNLILADFAVSGLKLYFTACPFIGLNIVLATYFVSTEKPFFAQIISMLRGFVILIPMAFLLSSIWEMTGVWCAYPMTELLVTIVAAVLYKINRLSRNR
jgi:putative MATE family efflux protein